MKLVNVSALNGAMTLSIMTLFIIIFGITTLSKIV
jgi:hypothetical protein